MMMLMLLKMMLMPAVTVKMCLILAMVIVNMTKMVRLLNVDI